MKPLKKAKDNSLAINQMPRFIFKKLQISKNEAEQNSCPVDEPNKHNACSPPEEINTEQKTVPEATSSFFSPPCMLSEFEDDMS